MEKEEFILIVSDLSIENKSKLFCRLAYDLTIFARESFSKINEIEELNKAKAYNEILHILLNKLSRLLSQDTGGYTDSALIEIIWSKAITGDFESDVAWAFRRGVQVIKNI